MSLSKLSPIELLTGPGNYAAWAFKLKSRMVLDDLWDAIEKGDTSKSPKALAIIGISVDNKLVAPIRKCETAKEAWELLKGIYASKSAGRRLKLRRDLVRLMKRPQEPLADYFARAQEIGDALIEIGDKLEETDLVVAVLAGLPDEYMAMAEILMCNKKLTMGETLGKVSSVESAKSSLVQQQSEEVTPVLAAHYGGQQKGKGPLCYACGKHGHKAYQCRDRKGGKVFGKEPIVIDSAHVGRPH